ncbi:hypothetical protein FRB99_007325 [Tulasnella sp. 403]|nr:hypothetical protein FRB99_007325 [Tulasnella sp. 403]
MPVTISHNGPSNALQRIQSRASGMTTQLPIRPHRRSIFQHPDWPPAPQYTPPTPAVVRAARSRPSYPNAAAGDLPATGPPVTAGRPTAKLPRAQEMQARALAAQAAHQQRFAVNLPAHTHPNAGPFTAGPAAAPDGTVRGVKPTPASSDVLRDRSNLSTTPTQPSLSMDVCFPSLDADADVMDEIQVDLSLPMVTAPSPDPTGESPVPFTSPSAPVDISAFLPPPGPPVLVANDASIAASAVPIADWAAALCWSLMSRSLSPRLTTCEEQTKWFTSLIDTDHTKQNSSRVAPATFTSWVTSTLSATLPSPQCLILGLYYISKLPIGHFDPIPNDLKHSNAPPGVLALFSSFNTHTWSKCETTFRDTLYRELINGHNRDIGVAQHIFTLALMLGNKWLEDNTFTTRTWHEVTSLPQAQLRALEIAALATLEFSLVVSDVEWHHWLLVLRTYTSRQVIREPIGLIGTANGTALGRLDNLLAAARPDGQAGVHATSPPGPVTEDEDVVLVASRVGQDALSVGRRDDHLLRHTSGNLSNDLSFRHGTSASHSDLLSVHRQADHSQTYRLGIATATLPTDYSVPSNQPVVPHSPIFATLAPNTARPTQLGYTTGPRVHSHPDPFELIAPHPALVSARIEARNREMMGVHGTHVYHWDRVQAEIIAEEYEQATFVSAWPQPFRMEWANHGSHMLSAVGG